MSTEIKSVSGASTLTVLQEGTTASPCVGLIIDGKRGSRMGDWDRADFLAAVAAECDAIVIDRATLPEVQVEVGTWPLSVRSSDPDDGMRYVHSAGPNSPNGKPEWHRNRALAHLALAEYLDAHPPVDEARVEALAGLLDDVEADNGWHTAIARRLLATGRIEVKP